MPSRSSRLRRPVWTTIWPSPPRCSDRTVGSIREQVRPPDSVTGATDAAEPTSDPEYEEPVRGGREVPGLVRYQLMHGPHAGEPTTERGAIERLARECQAAACQAGLDSTVIETRFNVVRSSVPETVATVRRLRDYCHPWIIVTGRSGAKHSLTKLP